MMKIPFSVLPPKKLYRYSRYFRGVAQRFERKLPVMQINLNQAESSINAIDYISMSLAASSVMFFVFLLLLLPGLKMGAGFVGILFFSAILTLFVFFQQLSYPKLVASRRVRLLNKIYCPHYKICM